MALLKSAPDSISHRSDGLMGAASTRTTTSFGPGAGAVTSANDKVSSPVL